MAGTIFASLALSAIRRDLPAGANPVVVSGNYAYVGVFCLAVLLTGESRSEAADRRSEAPQSEVTFERLLSTEL